MQKSKRLHDRMFIKMEKILSSTILRRAYINFFERATLEEFEMVDIGEGDNVLHIGCGSLPNTLITLARNFPASYTGIDVDGEAVEIARDAVREYGLKNVEIERGDAISYPLKDFNIIIISYGVEPKEAVFRRLKNETKEDVRIVYRKQWDFMDAIYGVRETIPDGFKVKAFHKRRDMIKSYLLEKI